MRRANDGGEPREAAIATFAGLFKPGVLSIVTSTNRGAELFQGRGGGDRDEKKPPESSGG